MIDIGSDKSIIAALQHFDTVFMILSHSLTPLLLIDSFPREYSDFPFFKIFDENYSIYIRTGVIIFVADRFSFLSFISIYFFKYQKLTNQFTYELNMKYYEIQNTSIMK